MAKVLSLFRRRAPDADARAAPPPAPRPVPTPAQPPPQLVKPRSTNDDGDGSGDGSDALTLEAAPPVTELVVARRQSQINLNKYLATAPSGLNAVLKQPSRGDMLESIRSQGSYSIQPALSVQQSMQLPQQQSQQQQQQALMLQQQQSQTPLPAAGGESPPVRPARERRRSMAASEMAATLQNIDVTQAAMIMMPARLRQELVGAQQSYSQPLPNPASLSGPLRASAPLPAAVLSADSYSLAAVLNNAGGAAATAAAPPRLERKPSLIREAVKVQTQQQQQQPALQTRGSVAPESPFRSYPPGNNSGGDSQQQQQQSATSAFGSQGPDRGSGGTLAARRGAAPAPALSQQYMQQMQQPVQGGMMLGGQSRASMAVGGVGGLGSPPPTTHGLQRRSDMGEPSLRARGSVPLGYEAPGAAGLVLGSNGGFPLSPSVNANGSGYMVPNAASNKDSRRGGGGGMATRGSEPMAMSMSAADDDGPMAPGSSSQYDAVRLPVIGGNGTPTRRVHIEVRDKEAAAAVHQGGGGGRGGLSAADVAALSDAISSYQSEAVRLRAMAIRKVDSRIKRAVMDRRLTADEVECGGSSSLLESGVGGSLLAPLMRAQQVQGGSSRGNLQQPASRGGPRGGAQTGPGAGMGVGVGGVDAGARARTRLQETEADTSEESSYMRKSSQMARGPIASEHMSDPSMPRRR